MGGQAFANLNVPRMPPRLYEQLRRQCHDKLKPLYATVVTPAEAPGKLDYGDIDFLVAVDDGCESPGRDDVAKALGAKQVVGVGGVWSFAVAWPQELGALAEESEGGAQGLPHAQVDVHVCHGDRLQWEAFKQGYGDLWQILGSFIRPYGLTANDQGLYVRVGEIEKSNKKASMLFLTSSPVDCLEFLMLDVEAYDRGFSSEESLFKWLRGCRCFQSEGGWSEENANDRKRFKKRPMYRRFMEQWEVQNGRARLEEAGPIPPASTSDEKTVRPLTRQRILEEALDRFGRRPEHDEMVGAHQRAERESQFWERARAQLQSVGVEGDRLNRATRALSRWVRIEKGLPVVRGVEEMDAGRQLLWTNDSSIGESELLEWIQCHWLTAVTLEKARIKANKAARGLMELESDKE